MGKCAVGTHTASGLPGTRAAGAEQAEPAPTGPAPEDQSRKTQQRASQDKGQSFSRSELQGDTGRGGGLAAKLA